MKQLGILLLSILPFTSFGQSYTVENVPNTRLSEGHYVSNPDTILRDETVRQMDTLLHGLEQQTTAQVAVVVLNSIGDSDVFDFAQRLFERWGIGRAQKDNGLLILFIEDQHTVRFHTGDGLEGILTDVVCKRIQTDKMVPEFRKGDYDGGLLAGVQEVVRILSDPAHAGELKDDGTKPSEFTDVEAITFLLVVAWMIIALIFYLIKKFSGTFANSKKQRSRNLPTAQLTSGKWLLWFGFLPIIVMIALTFTQSFVLLFGGLYAYFAAMVFARQQRMERAAQPWHARHDYQTIYNFYQQNQTFFSVMRFFFPLPFAFLYRHYLSRKESFRSHPRSCRRCQHQLERLDEASDDMFLSKGQLKEEALDSVDYDVWKCLHCGEVERLRYINPKTKYTVCPTCKVQSYHVVSNTTLEAPTEHATGEGEEISVCEFCGDRNVRRYSIAKLASSSSSSSSGRGSSSGGSWGGGSSGGGGASSRW